ncbi:MAG TPA: TonB-dependent receptor [Acidobacteriaceae bacterium]
MTRMKLAVTAAIFAAQAFAAQTLAAQSACTGSVVTGAVQDATAAIIPGASVSLDGGATVVSRSDGTFRLPCIRAGKHAIHVSANSFAAADVSFNAPRAGVLNVVLQAEGVQTTVEVDAATAEVVSSSATGASRTISGKQLQSLADDPDDLLRELQQLGASAGAAPGNTSITVDGFQGDEGNGHLPPKSSIAYIKVNPDLFSSEYRQPPFGGGHIEVYTKPGQSAFHGAAFATNGSPWMNARDPFSVSRASLGKQRYGFELTGPIREKGSDFSLTMEHRLIDNFAVVNAITLDSAGNAVSTVGNVATPQRLWLGTLRFDWQLTPKNTFIATYDLNRNHLSNVGVGGTSLAETGYDSQQFSHTLRLTNITTASAQLMHEARLEMDWNGEDDIPASSAAQIQVAGAFTGGGATVGRQKLREFEIEFDDDAILNTKKHLMKFGIQTDTFFERKRLTTNFNGSYLFGGGIAPVLDANNQPVNGQTEAISGLEQYRRALDGYAGGTPTDFSDVTGNPQVNLVQTRDAIFFQDAWKVLPNLEIAYGVRYFGQNDVKVTGALTPRLGISWSPDKKATWNVHGHAGLFAARYRARDYAEVLRMDGVQRVTSTIYNPVFGSPFTGATPIQSIRTLAPSVPNLMYGIENIGFTHSFPHGWNFSGDYYLAQLWDYVRTENVNAPLNGSPAGPRPGPANLNILQLQSTGRGYGNVEFMSLEQHSLKRVQFFVGAVRVQIVDDTDDNFFSSPQTTGSNAGEYARRTGNPLWNVFGNASITLPWKIQWSGNFNGSGDTPFNITTGFDNNGDGIFNDRPQYAQPGTPGAMATPWGLLTNSGGIGSLPRNKGMLPWTTYLDTNLQRTFHLTESSKAAHPQTVVVNIRSSNVLNHMNVTQVGNVLGSPLFGVPYKADNGRRVEAGVRYTF